jgi:hypothetical protein
MAWNGYLSIAGNEICNATRTAQYAASMRVPWFHPQEVNNYLPLMLGNGAKYRTPLLDDAPWTDPDVPESYDFLGFYPIEFAGLEDSSREATITEYITPGGSVGDIRHATKSVVVNGLLIALSEDGAEYGMQWLRQATLGGPCEDGDPFGGDMCFLSASPKLDIPDTPAVLAQLDGGNPDATGALIMDGGGPDSESDEVYDGGDPFHTGGIIEHSEDIFIVPSPTPFDPTACLEPYRRSMRNVKVPGGPTITTKYGMSSGAMWGVQFTAVAGVPWIFAAEVDVVTGFLTDDATGIATNIDVAGVVVPEVDCADTIWGPAVDPLCPALIPPPGPVDVPLGCADLPANWRRRQFTIPSIATRLWSDMVPVINVHGPADSDLRNLRLRFYSDPFDEADPSLDPCAYCGDILFSYVPAGSTITLDAASEQVYITTAGGTRRLADSLVFGADSKPFDWPSLTCGFAYTVTVDLPQVTELPSLDLTMIPRAR